MPRLRSSAGLLLLGVSGMVWGAQTNEIPADSTFSVTPMSQQTVSSSSSSHLIFKPNGHWDVLSNGETLPDHCLATGKGEMVGGRLQIRAEKMFCISADKQQFNYDLVGSIVPAGTDTTGCMAAEGGGCKIIEIKTGDQFQLRLKQTATLEILRTQPGPPQ